MARTVRGYLSTARCLAVEGIHFKRFYSVLFTNQTKVREATLNFCSECWSVFLRLKLKLLSPSSAAQDLGMPFHHSFSKLLFKARDAKTSRQHHFNSELPLLILQGSERLPHYPVRGEGFITLGSASLALPHFTRRPSFRGCGT